MRYSYGGYIASKAIKYINLSILLVASIFISLTPSFSQDPLRNISGSITNVTQGGPIDVNATSFPYIQFLGATQMVGGSCYLIDTGKTRILIDYGLFYGPAQEGLNGKILFNPKKIDYVLLTHAHIDHSGQLPLLYKRGFTGKVVGTDATKSILGIMLEMSLNISKQQGKALYSFDDFSKTMDNYMVIPYDTTLKLSSDVSVRYRDAGHILGSAMIEIWIKTKNENIKVVTTGDLGSKGTPILRDPAIIKDADYILVESTYGAIKRDETDYERFGNEIGKTIQKGGSVLIPAFVLEKTQKVIYVLGLLMEKGIIPQDTPVYVDSSTAIDINRIYRKYTEYYDKEAKEIKSHQRDPLSFASLHEVSGKAVLNAHKGNKPAIYISSSGMLDHANAPKHLSELIENPNNLLVIVGWQSPVSLGRKLLEGAKRVKIPIEEYKNAKTEVTYVDKSVNMKVETFGEFSSHADGCQILEWLSNFKKCRKVFVVHGDKQNSEDLAINIQKRLGFYSYVPSLNDIISFKITDSYKNIKKIPNLCSGLNSTRTLNSLSDQ